MINNALANYENTYLPDELNDVPSVDITNVCESSVQNDLQPDLNHLFTEKQQHAVQEFCFDEMCQNEL